MIALLELHPATAGLEVLKVRQRGARYALGSACII